MNLLHKTLPRTFKSTTFFPSIPSIRHNPFSLSSPYSTKLPSNDLYNATEKKKLARPSEIRFQPKVANLVNLVGTVTMPVKFRTSVDGKSWASTLISHQHPPFFNQTSLWIRIIFEGDLAVTAATHLKEKDTVHVTGHLSSDFLPIYLTNDQSKSQLMVHDVYLVRQFHPEVMKHLYLHKRKDITYLPSKEKMKHLPRS
ncbi:hypothetical protein SOVF_172810 isoform A [Spinacia oleracea]|nr:hypothetical protein SOVF_172810 isoform A [Spinacia oleracea]